MGRGGYYRGHRYELEIIFSDHIQPIYVSSVQEAHKRAKEYLKMKNVKVFLSSTSDPEYFERKELRLK